MKHLYLLTLLFFVGCKTHKSQANMPLLECSTAIAKDSSINNQMSFTSQIYSNSTITIEPRVNGYLIEKNFKRGMPVKAGELLFKLDPTQINTQLTQSKAQLASAQAELIRANNDYQRAIPLSKINAISSSSLDEYKATYLSAKSSVDAAVAALKSAELNTKYTVITAPVSGIIQDSGASIGDWVGVGTKYGVLAQIYVTDTVQVKLALPMNNYITIHQHDSLLNPSYDNKKLISNIRLTLSNGSIYPENGIYDYTESSIDKLTGTMILIIKFANKEMFLKPNQFVKIDANIGSLATHIVIPQEAVIQSQGQSNIFVVSEDNTVDFRKVELGKTINDKWIIKSGLKKGERVLTSGLTKVKTGQKINIAH